MSVGLAWLAGLLASILCPPSDHPTDTAREYFCVCQETARFPVTFPWTFPPRARGSAVYVLLGFLRP
uniref:Putative secreted protein n=1 Tax=Anopheles marajoara TaxID=58244 RepID=A0A2M4CFM6_9DIPT